MKSRYFSVLFALAFVVCHAPALIAGAGQEVSEEVVKSRLIGQWMGQRHLVVYYANGTYALDPSLGHPARGKWRFVNGKLFIRYASEEEVPEKIIRLDAKEFVYEEDGHRYRMKRAR